MQLFSKYIFWVLIISMGCLSCQKVIQVDLKDADEKYIVDALVTDSIGLSYVKLSKTTSFYTSNLENTRIADALVIVTNETTNQAYTFVEETLGIYKHPTLVTAPGETYRLMIVIDKDTITANNTVPAQKVEIDSLYVRKSEFSFIGDMHEGVPAYKDPIGLGNNYLLWGFLNGKNTTAASFTNDEFRDGQVNKSAVSFRTVDFEKETNLNEFLNGDTLTVALHNVTKPVYTFFSTLFQNSSAIVGNPANPTSNVNGKAIGVFVASTVSYKSIIAQY